MTTTNKMTTNNTTNHKLRLIKMQSLGNLNKKFRWTIFQIFNIVRLCSIFYKFSQVFLILLNFVQICSVLINFVQLFSTLFNFVHLCLALSIFVQLFAILFKIAQLCTNFLLVSPLKTISCFECHVLCCAQHNPTRLNKQSCHVSELMFSFPSFVFNVFPNCTARLLYRLLLHYNN